MGKWCVTDKCHPAAWFTWPGMSIAFPIINLTIISADSKDCKYVVNKGLQALCFFPRPARPPPVYGQGVAVDGTVGDRGHGCFNLSGCNWNESLDSGLRLQVVSSSWGTGELTHNTHFMSCAPIFLSSHASSTLCASNCTWWTINQMIVSAASLLLAPDRVQSRMSNLKVYPYPENELFTIIISQFIQSASRISNFIIIFHTTTAAAPSSHTMAKKGTAPRQRPWRVSLSNWEKWNKRVLSEEMHKRWLSSTPIKVLMMAVKSLFCVIIDFYGHNWMQFNRF